jgi:hypothetical protein
MRTSARSPLKYENLRRHASLNLQPTQVSDVLFRTHPFFDPCDLVQVKYEMLRRVMLEGKPVGVTAATFGFSRVTGHSCTNASRPVDWQGYCLSRRGRGAPPKCPITYWHLFSKR